MNKDHRDQIKIIETPRDGMQGINSFIPTQKKIGYINLLLKCGFDTVEVGSFVSPIAIPQMKDTAEVLEKLDLSLTKSKIAVLVANLKGGKMAAEFDQVNEIFFPFSTSPTFLKKNLNATITEAEKTVEELQNLCVRTGKELVTYLSMGFGDPYGDEWSIDLLYNWVEKLKNKGLSTIPLSDIMGDASPELIEEVFSQLTASFPDVEFGLHLHALAGQEYDKIDAAWQVGVRRFDTVINGMGGCPMTGKELVGNLSLEALLQYCSDKDIKPGVNPGMLKKAQLYPLLD